MDDGESGESGDGFADDLKVVVMSATLDVAPLLRFFEDAHALRIPGRQHPVSVLYAVQPQPDFLDAALQTCCAIHEEEAPGTCWCSSRARTTSTSPRSSRPCSRTSRRRRRGPAEQVDEEGEEEEEEEARRQ